MFLLLVIRVILTYLYKYFSCEFGRRVDFKTKQRIIEFTETAYTSTTTSQSYADVYEEDLYAILSQMICEFKQTAQHLFQICVTKVKRCVRTAHLKFLKYST